MYPQKFLYLRIESFIICTQIVEEMEVSQSGQARSCSLTIPSTDSDERFNILHAGQNIQEG
jgi:hypothetical protein